MDLHCLHHELPAMLPALQPSRDGGAALERIVFGVLLAGGAVAVVSLPFGGIGVGLGAILIVNTVLLIPAWMHLRLWPRMTLLSGDLARREEFHLAGLATPRHLWAMVRHPVERAFLLPFGLWVAWILMAVLGGLLFLDNDAAGGALAGALVATFAAFTPAFFGMAGAADVFGRLCRGMPRGQSALLSVCWILAAMIVPWLGNWMTALLWMSGENPYGLAAVPIVAFVFAIWTMLLGVRVRGLFFREDERETRKRMRSTFAGACLLALMFGPLLFVLTHWVYLLTAPALWLFLACMLMLSRVSFAIRAYCNADAA